MKKIKCDIERILKFLLKFTKYEKDKEVFNETINRKRTLPELEKFKND